MTCEIRLIFSAAAAVTDDDTNCRVGPNSVARCTVDPSSDGVYHVKYVPVEVGHYNINVCWNGRDVQG